MTNINDNIESPLFLKVSFSVLLDYYEDLVKHQDQFVAARAKTRLENIRRLSRVA